MVAQLLSNADDDGRKHFCDLADGGATFPSHGMDQGLDSIYDFEALLQEDTRLPMYASGWTGAPMTWEQQQQWNAWLSSCTWNGLDMNHMTSQSPQLSMKYNKMVQPTFPWTEMSLDPEKPTTPAKVRAVKGGSGSEGKMPQPVGSGRQKEVPHDTAQVPKKLPFAGNERQLLVKGEPAKLNVPAQPSSLVHQLPLEELLDSAQCDSSEDEICRLPLGLLVGISGGVSGMEAQKLLPTVGGSSDKFRNTSSSASSGSSTADSSGYGGGTPQAKRVSSPMDTSLAGQEITTVMVRNVPSNVKQSGFVKALEDTGFGGSFDFCYLPSAFDTGKNKGYAFINFVSIAAYDAFGKEWHGSRRFNVRAADPALNVSAAALQGLERNIEKWDAPRMRRVRNPEFRPFVVKNVRKGDASMVPVQSFEKALYSDAPALENTAVMAVPPGLLPSQGTLDMVPPPGLLPPPGLAL
jgi:hypothetical protein